MVQLVIIGGSFIVGCLCAYISNRLWGRIAAAGIPWFGLLAAILYTEYFIPRTNVDASMWPIAQLFGGTLAAAVGYGGHCLGTWWLEQRQPVANGGEGRVRLRDQNRASRRVVASDK